jgi:hypothetical protein
LQLQDDELGHYLSNNPDYVISMLHTLFEGFFNQEDMEAIAPLNGEPRQLAEITKEEVGKAVQKLNNGTTLEAVVRVFVL